MENPEKMMKNDNPSYTGDKQFEEINGVMVDTSEMSPEDIQKAREEANN